MSVVLMLAMGDAGFPALLRPLFAKRERMMTGDAKKPRRWSG
ncbi:hypothetical protein [Qipengyuania atrilutea]|nr:hypothetical protein [Actirhodobacter atriluteus]